MLAVEVEFLTGRYIATAYNSRADSEWPPHPARFFSALAATLLAEPSPAAEERAALTWLESLPAPAIRASTCSRREVVTYYVPVNDVGMTDVECQYAALDKARQQLADAVRSESPAAAKKARAALAKAEKAFSAAVSKNLEVPTRNVDAKAGRIVLPEHRTRQPRTFPSVTPVEPRVTFIWSDVRPTPELRAGLASILRRLVRLGHSSSLVCARLIDDPPTPNWRPADIGEVVLRVPQSGQLAALERAFAQHRETEPRVMPARFQPYTQMEPSSPITGAASCFSDDWVVLRRVGGPPLSMVAAAGLARSLRRALMAYTEDPIPAILSGHESDGSPAADPHLAIVPLPFVGHAHASGAILGVALVFPHGKDTEARRAVFTAMAAWESAMRMEDEDNPRLPLKLGAAGVMELERIEWGAVPSTLRPTTWCRADRVWHSVTPVALDRNPGDLRTRDPIKLAMAIDQAKQSLRQACVRIGLPEPVDIEILPAPSIAGAAKAKHYPPYPGDPGRVQRVLTHARIEFAEPVRGPILLGAGRFQGLGLFRPESRHG